MENKEYKFDGYDFVELIDCWNIDISDKIIEDNALPIQEFLTDVWRKMYGFREAENEKNQRYAKKIADDLRRFLAKLAKEDDGMGSYAPVWKAISEINDDYSLFQIAIPLIGYMWS